MWQNFLAPSQKIRTLDVADRFLELIPCLEAERHVCHGVGAKRHELVIKILTGSSKKPRQDMCKPRSHGGSDKGASG